ncbi:pyridoxamine 5'-phosphate oxidase family protein [Aromatoleum sp.]|uniref:pyridoxamine 5'-phosphate oxidase family protein n=1 Tax=Aromatoleum sp. TaxID=2307007 RepID=UPI002FC9536A
MSADLDCLSDPAHADFLTSGVSISVASCGADHLPNLTRGIGCDVSGDGPDVRVFVIAEQSRALLDDLRANRNVAVVFCQPGSHRSLQLKGHDASIESLVAGDARIIERYRGAFTDALAALGFGGAFVQALLGSSTGEVVAIRFTPAAAFWQTPGAGARRSPEDAR